MMGWGRLELWHRRGLEPGSYLRPAPSRRIVASALRTGGPRHHILASNAVTARARSGSDVVPLRFLSRFEGVAMRCGNLPGRRFPASTTLGKADHEMIAETTCGIGDRDWRMISALRYGVTVWTLNSGNWTKSIETNDATSMRARARASWGFTGGGQDVTLLSNRPSPNRRKGRLLCGAKTRAGGYCQVRAEPGKARCRRNAWIAPASFARIGI
jgi:hypothetical protein